MTAQPGCAPLRWLRTGRIGNLFSLGTSWGGFESLVLPAVPHRLRHLDALPDAGRLVRVYLGLEHAQDLCDDLAQAFCRL